MPSLRRRIVALPLAAAVAAGLWSQDYKAVVGSVRSLGYNTIRIPFSDQMVEGTKVPDQISFYGSTGPINTDLQGLTSMQVLDKIINYAGSLGLKVILDNHRSEDGNSAEQNGLWYTSAYPDSTWVNDWVALANRYKANPTSPVTGWTVGFTFPGDQKITSSWSSTYHQSGAGVTVQDMGYNAAIPPGGNVAFGLPGTWTTNDAAPTGFTLNGSACG